MKNEQLQAMGVTPWLGDTRVKDKGGKAAKRTLTDLCREARVMRDLCSGSQAACKALRDDVCNVLEQCQYEHAECLKAVELVGYMRARMRGDCCRVAWLVGGLCALNLAVVVVYMLLMGG